MRQLQGKRLFPALVCLDGATGNILWDKPLDHLSAVPAEVRDSARTAWTEVMADFMKRTVVDKEYSVTKDTNALEAAGYELDNRSNIVAKDKTSIKKQIDIARKAGFSLETWQHSGTHLSTHCVGSAFATPVSDGILHLDPADLR